MRGAGLDPMSCPAPDPIRSSRRLTGMAIPELISLIAATLIIIATLTFLTPES
jgi:hypothetical protein